MRKWNFCAGPAVISEEVLEEVKSELLEFKKAGASIMEISHRSKTFMEVAEQAKYDLVDILRIPKNYDVLFLQVEQRINFQWCHIILAMIMDKLITFCLAHGQKKQ